MKTSLAWLNDYLDKPIDAAEAEDALLGQGFPFDGVDEVSTPSGGVDTLLDVEVTSNRGDALSHVGLAREVAAATGRALKQPPKDEPATGATAVGDITRVEMQNDDACIVYTARVIRGVKIGPSPDWLADRLVGAGLRPVNNVVDITNFVLLETGQPLHAFDIAKLDGGRIVVRNAHAGENFEAIDGTRHTLKPNMLGIADASSAQAIAGVMGGKGSEVTEQTVDVLLESASFDPLSVRSTSRALKLSSDSSYRFERGVSMVGVEAASKRAAAMIVELAGGELAHENPAWVQAADRTRLLLMPDAAEVRAVRAAS